VTHAEPHPLYLRADAPLIMTPSAPERAVSSPVADRAAPSQGEAAAGSVSPESPPPPVTSPAEPVTLSSLPLTVPETAGTAALETRQGAAPASLPGPVQGRSKAPAAAASPAAAGPSPAGSEREDASLPAGSTGLTGAEFRDALKRAQSAAAKEGRLRRTRYIPVANRTAYRPGGNVRRPGGGEQR